MPLSRVAIAAVFFVVGALIVIPMFTSSSSSRVTSGTPSPSVTASVGVSPTPSKSPKGSKDSKTTHRASPSHTATRRPNEVLPSATPSGPLTAQIGKVRCPGRTVQVSVVNTGGQAEDYTILTDGSISVADRIPAGATRRSVINVKEDHTTTIAVTWRNIPIQSIDRHANCVYRSPGQTLPHTGPDSGMIFARVATGIAAMLTGIIIFWYGRQWPGRRDKMFDKTR